MSWRARKSGLERRDHRATMRERTLERLRFAAELAIEAPRERRVGAVEKRDRQIATAWRLGFSHKTIATATGLRVETVLRLIHGNSDDPLNV